MLQSAFVLSQWITISLTAAPTEAEFTPIFNGKTFEGWEGNTRVFRIANEAIIGGNLNEEIPHNEFLCTKREYADFELRLQFKLLGDVVNAGVQVRSERVPNDHEVSGFQADLYDDGWGALYDESRRNKRLAEADDLAQIKKSIRPNDWNNCTVRCEGRRIRIWINGAQTVDYTEPDEQIKQRGIIGLQIHGGPPAEAHYRNIRIQELSTK